MVVDLLGNGKLIIAGAFTIYRPLTTLPNSLAESSTNLALEFRFEIAVPRQGAADCVNFAKLRELLERCGDVLTKTRRKF